MTDSFLLHHLVFGSANRDADHVALVHGAEHVAYGALAQRVESFANGAIGAGIGRGERIAVWLDKRVETVVTAFGASAAGATFVPVNPLLKPDQVSYILRDCNVALLVTASDRWNALHSLVTPDLRHVVLVDAPDTSQVEHPHGVALATWAAFLDAPRATPHRVIDTDVVAILYTSGSTGRPKGVVLSHRNMVAGAKSVASYLENHRDDVLLAALPLSFDAGFSQLTTAFHVGARVVLLNYLLPKDALNAVVRERVTGLTGVPPLWIQLAQLRWPATVTDHLRYFANTGGRMPRETLDRLRTHFPRSRPFLMYGLTEAFRSTYLPPEEIDRRPDSIGKAIPNAEILVLREDGTPCAPNEPGELVHRGALVGLGYWNDPEKTAERYKPLPRQQNGLVFPEIAVFSGDTVVQDDEGFLYFVGRRDEMIKSSGYRISPTEVEEALYATRCVSECAAFGVPHPTLGQAVAVVVVPAPGQSLDEATLLSMCRERLPIYMQPAHVDIRAGSLPRNPNGKIDRRQLANEFMSRAETTANDRAVQ